MVENCRVCHEKSNSHKTDLCTWIEIYNVNLGCVYGKKYVLKNGIFLEKRKEIIWNFIIIVVDENGRGGLSASDEESAAELLKRQRYSNDHQQQLYSNVSILFKGENKDDEW